MQHNQMSEPTENVTVNSTSSLPLTTPQDRKEEEDPLTIEEPLDPPIRRGETKMMTITELSPIKSPAMK